MSLENDEMFLKGKKQGEKDRMIAELTELPILNRYALLRKARVISGSIFRTEESTQNCLLGYLIGYTRTHVSVETSSLTLTEVKDLPPALFLDYDRLE